MTVCIYMSTFLEKSRKNHTILQYMNKKLSCTFKLIHFSFENNAECIEFLIVVLTRVMSITKSYRVVDNKIDITKFPSYIFLVLVY